MSYHHQQRELSQRRGVEAPPIAARSVMPAWHTPLVNVAVPASLLLIAIVAVGLFALAMGAAWSLVGTVGGGLFVAGVTWLCWRESQDWLEMRRLELQSLGDHAADMREAYARAYAAGGGETIETTYREGVLRADNPLDVLAVALEVHRREMRGEPWGIHQLAGAIYARDGHTLRKIGHLTQDQAALMLDTLARKGLIEGRGQGKTVAGTWAPETREHVIELLEG